jgi:fusion and transport protein UGO1
MTSLRDSYVPSSSAWSFLPQPPVTDIPSIASQSAYNWSTRPKHNSIFDLSPSLDLTEASGINADLLFRSVVASVVLGYTSTAIAMPWEVGKMLLQVQWVPRHAREHEPTLDLSQEDLEVVSITCMFVLIRLI